MSGFANLAPVGYFCNGGPRSVFPSEQAPRDGRKTEAGTGGAMFELDKTIALIRGGLLDARATWGSYRAENRTWQYTAVNLTVPMILLSLVLTGILAWVFGSHYAALPGGGFRLWLTSAFAAVVGFAISVAVFTYLAGVFQGKADFDRGTAALSFAALPAYAGSVLGTLPWIGWLLNLVLAITSLVFLYQIIPIYLGVPDHKRVIHYVVSLIVTLVLAMILGTILGVKTLVGSTVEMSRSGPAATAPSAGGALGGLERQAEIYDLASRDTFDPPGDGRLSRAQVREYVRVMTATRTMQADQTERLEGLAEEMKDKEEASFADVAKFYQGLGSAITAGNAAMEIVKTSGGNWAEHVWVEEQLRLARYQPDLSDATRSNRKLYDEFAGELAALDAP